MNHPNANHEESWGKTIGGCLLLAVLVWLLICH